MIITADQAIENLVAWGKEQCWKCGHKAKHTLGEKRYYNKCFIILQTKAYEND